MNSRIPGFSRLSPAQRVGLLEERLGLAPGTFLPDLGLDAPDLFVLDRRSEGVVGALVLPLSVAPNFRVDGRDTFVPLVTEEPSVVAAASRGALLLREGLGIVTEVPPRRVAGQVQLRGVPDGAFDAARQRVEAARDELAQAAREAHPSWAAAGGDLVGLRAYGAGADLVALLVIDPGKAMGANLVTDLCERLASRLEALSGGVAGLRIVTNAAEGPPVRASGSVEIRRLHRDPARAEAIADGVQAASRFAESDPRRAVTHNKGIFNGIDAVLQACGQDVRAVEAAGHAHAVRDGRVCPLSQWRVDGGRLVGTLEVPLAVGTVGGAIEGRAAIRAAFRILGIEASRDPVRLSAVTAACGLAGNLAALTALAGDGLLRGHLRLHAGNVAAALGASPADVAAVTQRLRDEGGPVDRARVARLLASVRRGRDDS
jgi:hydroxymethylglutaryl-CoA reductase